MPGENAMTNARIVTDGLGREMLALGSPGGDRYLDPRLVVVRMSDLRVLIAHAGGLRALDAGEAAMVRLLDLPPGADVRIGGAL